MQRTAFAGIAALAIALAGCQNEPEEAPDITEAIPLDPEPEDGAAEDDAVPDETILPDAPPVSDGMESGSNPPDMTEPPAGSKVQPAD